MNICFRFFSSVSYVIGGLVYSLNDIENGILRSNRQSMGTLYRKPFKDEDPRLKVSLGQVDPRIHFALNCGAKSCPPITTFSGDQVQDQLKIATASFLEVNIYTFYNLQKRRYFYPLCRHGCTLEAPCLFLFTFIYYFKIISSRMTPL